MAAVQYKIKEWREFMAMPQEELARKAHLHRMSIVRLENGVHEPRPTTAQRIATALGISVHALRVSPWRRVQVPTKGSG